MRTTPPFELPPEQKKARHQARRLEQLTIAYLVSAIVVVGLTLGSSQAMRAAWVEDLLSFVPPIAFLVAVRLTRRHPDHKYPFGYHRAVSIAYLCGALALLTFGVGLLVDSIMKLVRAEHPSIGTVQLFGRTIWLGWLMIPALVWSGAPVIFLGRAKLKLARVLNDKVLLADALMNKADWLTASAAIAGVLGIAFGLWWADAAAACLISLDIAHDGVRHLRASTGDLMDRTPRTVDYRREDPLPGKLQSFLEREPWIDQAEVRMREEGHVYFADALVVAYKEEADLVEQLAHTTERALELDWRLHDLVIMPVKELPRPSGDAREGREA